MNCPAHLWSQKNAQTIPGPTNEPQIPAKVPGPSGDQSMGAAVPPKSPLKPVKPIVIPKDTPNEDERLKQLESPETVELIKSFEIPDPVTPVSEPAAKPAPPTKAPTPPPVAVKPQPVVIPEPEQKPQPQRDPTDALFSPPAQQQQKPGDAQPAKDIKEATTDFLAQEYGQPKKTSKRYTKSRQKNNHS